MKPGAVLLAACTVLAAGQMPPVLTTGVPHGIVAVQARHAAPARHLPSFAEISGLHTISDVRISPDGREVLFLLGRVSSRDGRRAAEVWSVPADGGVPRKSTLAPGVEACPRWSPDGQEIAFLAARGNAERQVYVVDRHTGAERPLGPATAGASDFEWSPDGRSVAFLRRAPAAEARVENGPIPLGGAGTATVLHLLDVATGRAVAVSPGHLTVTRFSWGPDSRRLVASARDVREWPSDRQAVFVFSAAEPPREIMPAHDMTIALAWSQDGRTIAWLGREHEPDSGQLMVVAADTPGAQPRTLHANFPGSLKSIDFLPDGQIAFAALQSMEIGLFSTTLDGRLTTVLPSTASKPGSIGSGSFAGLRLSFSRDGRRVATSHSGPREPGNVVVGEWGGPLRPVTRLDPIVDDLLLGETEEIRWRAGDGLEIAGLLVFPVGYQPGRRYPAVVAIHGGPRRSWWNTCHLPFIEYSWAQVLAGRGYFVLLPNPRGSSGRGAAFVRGNAEDLGGRDLGDVFAGVDEVVRLGYADPSRLAVIGQSYGGYLTAMATTQTSRFRAAVVVSGPTNYYSMMGASGLVGWAATFWRDPLVAYKNPTRLLDRSPVRHAAAVRTPTLFLYGAVDTTVPPAQGEEMILALRAHGVPVEGYVYPGEGHVFQDESHQADALERTLAWLERHLGPAGSKAETTR